VGLSLLDFPITKNGAVAARAEDEDLRPYRARSADSDPAFSFVGSLLLLQPLLMYLTRHRCPLLRATAAKDRKRGTITIVSKLVIAATS
jgi:hypothetical protein